MTDLVRLDIDSGVANIRLNRPDRLNALDPALAESLIAALRRVDADKSVKAVTLTGEGRAFMAGGDLAVFNAAPEKAPQAAAALIPLFHEIVLTIRRMKPPVIAGVQGAVAGGGLGLALACDLVIAADNASFVPAYTRLGTSPDGGTTWSITQLIGQRRAMEWIMLGDPMNAADAHAIGLINRVVPAAKLADEVDRVCEARRRRAGICIRLSEAAGASGADRDVRTATRLRARRLRGRGRHRRFPRRHRGVFRAASSAVRQRVKGQESRTIPDKSRLRNRSRTSSDSRGDAISSARRARLSTSPSIVT